jgi:hypothetical protein
MALPERDGRYAYRIVLREEGGRTLTTLESDPFTVRAGTATRPLASSAALEVTRIGPGAVVSSPAGISCPDDCTSTYAQGTAVSLVPLPDRGAVFAGWQGARCGTAASACTVALKATTGISAIFARRTTLALTEAMIQPERSYRCVSPFARDHSSRMELELRYASGRSVTWESQGPSDTADDFLFCGGSVAHDLPGYASAPIRFRDPAGVSRIVAVTGIVGADRDAGAPGRRVNLTVSYNGERVCDFGTDTEGHARRFTCRGFPASSSLNRLQLKLDVSGDRKQGVFVGIAELQATVERG